MSQADPVSACTELMAALSLVSPLFTRLYISSVLVLRCFMFVFQATPWAATVSQHVKSLTIKIAATQAQETRAVKTEAHLESAQKLLETIQGQAKA